MGNVYDVTHALSSGSRVAKQAKKFLSSAWDRTNFPILVGKYVGAFENKGEKRDVLELQLLWKDHVVYSRAAKRTLINTDEIAVPKGIVGQIDYKGTFLAICSPINVRKDPHQRSLILPLIQIR